MEFTIEDQSATGSRHLEVCCAGQGEVVGQSDGVSCGVERSIEILSTCMAGHCASPNSEHALRVRCIPAGGGPAAGESGVVWLGHRNYCSLRFHDCKGLQISICVGVLRRILYKAISRASPAAVSWTHRWFESERLKR